jgi:hypothetical protein
MGRIRRLNSKNCYDKVNIYTKWALFLAWGCLSVFASNQLVLGIRRPRIHIRPMPKASFGSLMVDRRLLSRNLVVCCKQKAIAFSARPVGRFLWIKTTGF